MNSIATAVPTINVPFHGASLFVVNHNGEPFTPMKPIIDGMGMDWASQFTKLKQRFKTSVVKITMQLPNDDQRRDVICLALRKLNGWLQTISPNKVKPEIRDRVIQYQEECDDVLYRYWVEGTVVNPRKPVGRPRKNTTTDGRTPLRDAINMLVGKKGLPFNDAYKMVHQRFGVGHIDELTPAQIPEAIEYIHRVVLDGEFIGKEAAKPIVKAEPKAKALQPPSSIDPSGLIFKLDMMNNAWNAAYQDIQLVDPRMAEYLNRIMGSVMVYTMHLKNKVQPVLL
ncbi:phage antirepressor N-terminal domain-containing protein [Hafnia alvei]|uniref:phage antirepressor N-terminal domain-containing protein n=1 Tax=Hafnia alvei TaxID=569 RepID=UPI002DB58D18|nr:phage antirepressor N-terminal domain-containing protein [Hafnia alvei]MEB7890965.1 phage antirepressor N-terminal domain-containing protein [Hafnia alvei]